MAKVSKASVNYRPVRYSYGRRKCGNCSMFRPAPQGNRHVSGREGSCTLVAGVIRPQDVCDRWTAKGDGK